MHRFTMGVFAPAGAILLVVAVVDYLKRSRQLCRKVMIGLVAPAAYDLFRLPVVFAEAWGISSVVPQMDLFKVFPLFGTMILGQTAPQPTLSIPVHLIGWAYHFSNGAAFAVVTLTAHLVFGLVMGLVARWLWRIGAMGDLAGSATRR